MSSFAEDKRKAAQEVRCAVWEEIWDAVPMCSGKATTPCNGVQHWGTENHRAKNLSMVLLNVQDRKVHVACVNRGGKHPEQGRSMLSFTPAEAAATTFLKWQIALDAKTEGLSKKEKREKKEKKENLASSKDAWVWTNEGMDVYKGNCCFWKHPS